MKVFDFNIPRAILKQICIDYIKVKSIMNESVFAINVWLLSKFTIFLIYYLTINIVVFEITNDFLGNTKVFSHFDIFVEH